MKGDSGKLRDEGRKVIVVRLNEEEELVWDEVMELLSKIDTYRWKQNN